ncbi:periplasmic nitrate reductase, NapE protein [Polycladidibacter hongkongensis]|uniref:periplasmic nitrate reductase, NapE protein n=1 Tax=Polycladidibacter hongkongensis TaxID=1647556 RepID=UPI000833407D|nr:nitrate reductase [Pseudovibrio hongkongensis]
MTSDIDQSIHSKAKERIAFFLLAVVLAPVVVTALVGGYGFILWMSQILFGPPTV